MLYITYLHFRLPHLPVIDITSIQSLVLCKLLTTLTGSPQRKVSGLVGSSLYSIQLHYKLKVLAPGTLASIPPVWAP